MITESQTPRSAYKTIFRIDGSDDSATKWMYLVSLNYSLKSGRNGKFYIRCILPQYLEHSYWTHEWAEMCYTRKEEQGKEAIPTILPGSPWGSFWLIATTEPKSLPFYHWLPKFP